MLGPCRDAHAKAVAGTAPEGHTGLGGQEARLAGACALPLASASLAPAACRGGLHTSRQEQAFVCVCPCAVPSAGNVDCWEWECRRGCAARAGASRLACCPAFFCLRSGLAPARCRLSGTSRWAPDCSQPSEAGRSPPFLGGWLVAASMQGCSPIGFGRTQQKTAVPCGTAVGLSDAKLRGA